MKKFFAVLLVLVFCMTSVSALAAGKLNVAQENFYTVTTSYSVTGYVFAKVENTGDKTIGIKGGLFEVYDADGETVATDDYPYTYLHVLEPGEYTYVRGYGYVSDPEAVMDDYTFEIYGKGELDYIDNRLPVETELALDYKEGYSTYNYMFATVTNDTEETAYDVEVVMALLAEDGQILYVNNVSLYNVGITAGSSATFRINIDSAFMDYINENGITVAGVDAIAFTEKWN